MNEYSTSDHNDRIIRSRVDISGNVEARAGDLLVGSRISKSCCDFFNSKMKERIMTEDIAKAMSYFKFRRKGY